MLTLYPTTVLPFMRALKNSAAYIRLAQSHISTNNIDPNDFLQASLAPDMFDFTFQVYSFCDMACAAVQRVVSDEPVPKPEWEKGTTATFDELLVRIETAIGFLESVKEQDFEGKEGKEVVIIAYPPNGKTLRLEFTALDYLNYWAMPNFWFHLTTAYDILRSKGVDIGKAQFLNACGAIEFKFVEDEEEKAKS